MWFRLAILLVLASAACGPGDHTQRGPDAGAQPVHVVIGSDLPRLEPNNDPSPSIAARNRFALELLPHLSARAENFAFSPISISWVMGQAYAGARRQTETEMGETLAFDSGSWIHDDLNILDLALTQGRGSYLWNSVDTLWGQVGLPYLVSYLDRLAQSYGADLHLVDFEGQPEDARKAINEWFEAQTGGEVNGLVEPGEIAAGPWLVASNAVRLGAWWREEFPEESTHPETFTRLDGSTVTVSMMVSQESDCYRYMDGDSFEAMELFFDGDELSMIVLLPRPGRFAEVQSALDPDLMSALIDGFGDTSMSISLPRFSTHSRFRLGEVLADLGMPTAFSSTADFSGVTGNVELEMGGVVHEIQVTVDEVGLNMSAGSLGVHNGATDRLVVNRPFLYFVRDLPTGAILLAGRVLDPTDG